MEAITGTLGLNWQGLIWHSINFIVLLVLLRLVLFKPVVAMLDARAQRVRESMEQADAARRAAEQAEADRQALLAETRREAEQIRARADEQAKRILADAEARAQERQQQIADSRPRRPAGRSRSGSWRRCARSWPTWSSRASSASRAARSTPTPSADWCSSS